jgi:hypothetical protein
MEHFGFTEEAVVAAARDQLRKAKEEASGLVDPRATV